MLGKLKSFIKGAKKKVIAVAVAMSMAAMTAVAACAETTEATTEATNIDLMQNAADTLIASFSGFIGVMIPTIMTIIGAGLVIFGIIALVKLVKKIFGKVAG